MVQQAAIDPQLTCRMFTHLPGELRNAIYTLALTTSTPITDPSNSSTKTGFVEPTRHHRIPAIGIALRRTCKRAYSEICTYPLYTSNTFRFTSATSAHWFLSRLSREQAEQIRDVEVDLREISDSHPSMESEWVQYMCWATEDSVKGIWRKKLGGLRIDAPRLKTLRLNIEDWQRTETFKGVALLRDLMRNVEGLERIVVTGTDGSALLVGMRERYLQRWGPVIFVGVMRFARLAGVVDWMSHCLKRGEEQHVVKWSRIDQSVTLEVMTWSFFIKETGSDKCYSFGAIGVDSGCCYLAGYEQRWQSQRWPDSAS
jgi:hypothetical protein